MKKTNSKFNEKKWKDEFEQFMDPQPEVKVSPEQSQQICQTIRNELMPSFSKVLQKLALVQAISGSATLTICPQFGIGPLGGGSGVVGFIEPFGPLVCGAFCGSFFLLFSALIAGFIFSRPERNQIAKNPLLAFSSISLVSFILLSLISFMVAPAQHHSANLTFVTMWFISGITTSSVAFWMTAKAKSQFFSV